MCVCVWVARLPVKMFQFDFLSASLRCTLTELGNRNRNQSRKSKSIWHWKSTWVGCAKGEERRGVAIANCPALRLIGFAIHTHTHTRTGDPPNDDYPLLPGPHIKIKSGLTRFTRRETRVEEEAAAAEGGEKTAARRLQKTQRLDSLEDSVRLSSLRFN